MAFWSSWSDGKKWLMGIMASVTTALLIGTGNLILSHVFPTPADRPVAVHKARTVVQHVGAIDPTNEKFSDGRPLALPSQQNRWKEIFVAPSKDPAAWLIANPVVGAVPYQYLLNDADRDEARAKGWRITLRVHLLRLTDPDGVIHANFDTGVRRYDLNVVPAAPHHPDTSGLIVRLNTFIRKEGTVVGGREAATEEPLDASRTHEYVMTYDPANSYAMVYVDDQLRLKEKYEGHTDYTRGLARFMFGTSGTESTFELVRFEIFQ